ncbi:MAG TPA: M56 family metallopeptidase [Tissierellales bacterium]|nr:M56 family metallopeptidase [Tissierellales bacterium]
MNKGISIIFYIVLYMSFLSTFVALLIMLIRLILGKKLSAFFSYSLWSLLLVRLIVPITFASESSMFNYLPSINDMQIIYKNSNKNIQLENYYKLNHDIVSNGTQVDNNLIPIIWIMITIALIIVLSTSYILSINKFKEAIRYNTKETANIIELLNGKNIRIYTVEWIDTPVVCGVFNPKIIIPTYITKDKNKDILKAVLLHEVVHIKRKDNLIKLISIFIACLHWFNPIVWIALVLYHTDMERACDEKVMQITKGKFKKKYAEALLSFTVDKSNIIAASTIAFGESNVKKRIKRVLKYKKTKFIAKSATIVIFFSVLFLTISDSNKNIVQINLKSLEENRQERWIDIDNISPFIIKAVVLSQDQKFYYHNGVDLISIARSSINNLILKKDTQGASTITMQLIKNVCDYNNINVLEKKRTQLYSAIQLEKNYSKDEIIEAYLNVIYFGRNIIGIKDAAQFYFNKTPLELTKEESAKLISILDNPKEYDLVDKKENNERKAKVIIDKINKSNMEECS